MKYKKLGSWVSILAILFVSLMPIISQAFEKNQSTDYQVICSANGFKITPLYNQNQNDIKDKYNINHCGFCSFVIDDEVLKSKIGSSKNILLLIGKNLENNSLVTSKNIFLSANLSQAPPSI
tara:strand:- start:722 stop:1087 length:366 start_codon:yes stop_codon:yes gene_type:complete